MVGLPKSYLIKQRRDQLNNICHITHTPGTAAVAQVLFSDLLKERLRDYFASHPDGQEETKKTYKTLQETFADVFKDINGLYSENKIEVYNRSINFEFFLGGIANLFYYLWD